VNRAIYLRNGQAPDAAIEHALVESGCHIEHTHTIVETLQAIYDYGDEIGRSAHKLGSSLLVIAEVQCGGIPLLMVVREELRDAPAVLLLDRSSDNVRNAVQALQLGASEYLLSTDSPAEREERTRALVQRLRLIELEGADAEVTLDRYGDLASSEQEGVSWDPIANRIMIDAEAVELTPIQGRIFDRLWARRNTTVSTEDLIRLVLLRSDINVREGARLLRPHLVRLRDALDQHPKLAHRIVNIRGSGYMLI
jgi:DNA-binding response OmpR family regulator